MRRFWLTFYGNICRYILIETRPDAYGCNSHVRARLDCDGCGFELVGQLSKRAFNVESIKIADRLIPEKLSLKVFETFGDAYAYQSLGEKGINETIWQAEKDMKARIREKSAKMVDDFHKQNQKYASRIKGGDATGSLPENVVEALAGRKDENVHHVFHLRQLQDWKIQKCQNEGA